MSTTSAKTFLRNAQEQRSQLDINQSMFRAFGELLREMKDMESEIQRLRRAVNRRF